jgi:hypothetical protein
MLAISAALAVPSALAATIYDNLPSPRPGNVPSLGFEANATSEFGGQVEVAGTQRARPTVTLMMSTWACETGHGTTCATSPGATFTQPLTLNLYAVEPDNSPGALISSVTRTFEMPYRPSANPNRCGATGKWYAKQSDQCFNGKAFSVTFGPQAGVTLPDRAIVAVAYDTTHYGSSPYGEGTPCYIGGTDCGYDSLNVGLASSAPSVGGDPLPADAYLNSTHGGAYCDGGSGGTGSFRLDAGCWAPYQPAIRIQARRT